MFVFLGFGVCADGLCCLILVRRGIICAADTTPEAGKTKLSPDGRLHWSFDDWRQEHRCRDWDAVEGWMHDHDQRWH